MYGLSSSIPPRPQPFKEPDSEKQIRGMAGKSFCAAQRPEARARLSRSS
jgi:hypothetical protein